MPVALVVEEYTICPVEERELSSQEAESKLADFSSAYLGQHMVAGRILSQETALVLEQGCYRRKGEYVCIEMIGKMQREQIGEQNGKSS